MFEFLCYPYSTIIIIYIYIYIYIYGRISTLRSWFCTPIVQCSPYRFTVFLQLVRTTCASRECTWKPCKIQPERDLPHGTEPGPARTSKSAPGRLRPQNDHGAYRSGIVLGIVLVWAPLENFGWDLDVPAHVGPFGIYVTKLFPTPIVLRAIPMNIGGYRSVSALSFCGHLGTSGPQGPTLVLLSVASIFGSGHIYIYTPYTIYSIYIYIYKHIVYI